MIIISVNTCKDSINTSYRFQVLTLGYYLKLGVILNNDKIIYLHAILYFMHLKNNLYFLCLEVSAIFGEMQETKFCI